MATERVQKILAQAGIASRRKAEEMIQEGLVTINGKLAQLGDKADLSTDSIKVKGKLLRSKEPPIYVAFNKPRQVISMLADPEGRPTLADFLSKVKARVFPIGRLDFNSEGLILLTNDGDFAEKMQKMEGIPRVYHVKVRGRPDASMVDKLEKGARVGNRLVKPHSVRMAEELANKIRVEVVFTDSGAVDVKGLFELKGFLVESIRRTAIGQITLKGLLPGHFRFLKASQVEALLTHPELGLRNISDEGRPSEDEGFSYRSPLGKKGEELEKQRKREEAAAARGHTLMKPELPKPRSAIAGAKSAGVKPKRSFEDHKSRGPAKPRFDRDERRGPAKPRFDREERGSSKPRFDREERGSFKPRFNREERSSQPRYDDRRGSPKPRFADSGERRERSPKMGRFRDDRGPSKPRFGDDRGGSRKPRVSGRIQVTRKGSRSRED